MKKERFGFDDARRKESGEERESEHERNRRIKSEQERLLRKQLSRIREADEDEFEDAPPRRG